MSTPVSRRILWPVVVANLLLIALGGATGTALAQGKPTQPQQEKPGRDAPTAYTLQGDTTNTGTNTTVFSTTSASDLTAPYVGWEFINTRGGGITLRASGTAIGIAAVGSSVGVSGTSTSGAGVYGESTSNNGVFGKSSTNVASGVYGENLSGGYGVAGRSNSGNGVYGESTTGNGVSGKSSSSSASGVYGENLADGYGVAGRSNSPSTGVGAVFGDAVGSGSGVVGTAITGFGVYGHSSYGNGSVGQAAWEGQAGVLGYNINSSEAGYGVRGYVTSSSVSSYGGYFSATVGIGLYGKSNSGRGVVGESGSSFGLYGKSTSGIGLYGFSTSNIGLYGQTGSGNYGLYAVNPSKAAGKYAGFFEGNVRINGSYVATGTKSALVYTNQGERLMYAEESTMNRFSDEGTATLKDGRAVIKIDPLFAQTVSLGEGYQVFAMPGSANTLGLAIINKTSASFEVVELGKGKGNFSFDWRVTALRKGYEKQRMELAPPAPAAPLFAPAEPKDRPDK